MGNLVLSLGGEPGGRSFDLPLQPLEERLLPKPRRDGIPHLHPDSPGIAAHRTPRPKQAGIESNRNACNAQLGIEPRYAIRVSGLGSGLATGSFRKDDDRTIASQLSPPAGVHLR